MHPVQNDAKQNVADPLCLSNTFELSHRAAVGSTRRDAAASSCDQCVVSAHKTRVANREENISEELPSYGFYKNLIT